MTTNVQHKDSFNINEHFTELLNGVGLDPADTGGTITFVGEDPIFESAVRLGAAYSIPYMGTAAAAAMIWRMRTGRGQDLKIDLRKAVHYIADIPFSTLNGRIYPMPYAKGCNLQETIYLTKDGRHFVPVGFYPHMERAWCDFLGCTPFKNSIASKIAERNALELETECNARGLVGGMVRTVEEWANTECGQQLAQTPVIEITKIADSEPEPFAPDALRPLSGLRVVCNTHEIAGTAIGRTLAEQGAEGIQTTPPDGSIDEPFRYSKGRGQLCGLLEDRLNSPCGKAWFMYSPPTYPSFKLLERRSIMSAAFSDKTYRRRCSRVPGRQLCRLRRDEHGYNESCSNSPAWRTRGSQTRVFAHT